MANPPIVIGPFSTVPAPGSAMRSDWPQEITTDMVALLDRQPRRFSVNGSAGTSGGTFANIQALTLPAQPVAGMVYLWSFLRLDIGTITGAYLVNLKAGATDLASMRLSTASSVNTFTLTASHPAPANVAFNANVAGAGTANVTTYAGPLTNRLDALWIADPFVAN